MSAVPSAEANETTPLVRRSLPYVGWESLILENRGSTARDHLGNERTYLAWFRTSFTLFGLCCASLQHFDPDGFSTGPGKTHQYRVEIGVTMAVLTFVCIVVPLIKYLSTQHKLAYARNPMRPSRSLSTIFVSISVFAVLMTLMTIELEEFD
ncbi:hypothetical protein K493DRAFT_317913 [Basidiobolus meristosporus CBS 931.73]|uniref:DUF202 domain-containing protein n=1 Tax=Basidiobolus meristosporus CBS 931.73 TaxID=1314790 RepID=A0A1Y1XXR2_9FUNG|nr:hypothetical protein K493DRAFT_317913 [Basidiobolus meristosporus CBS 931.73]|eukprot:ORX90533.1 hypothetical protein K493DRAFT_317913 [Basidiobolus meristosporus CBS 931.73]